MKKRFIPVVLAALLAFGAAGCDNGKEPGPGPEPTPTPVAQYEVSITNKDVLSGEWRISDGAKKVEIATNPQANIASLIADEVLEITSSNPAVATVLGQNINPVAVGKTTITVRCGDSVDSVEVEILARQHGTFEEDPLTVAEAVTTAKALEQGATSTIVYYVKGIVKSNTWDASYKNGTMWLKDGDAEFELYRYGMDDKCSVDPTTITPGMIVTAYGNIQNFQGKTFEMTQGCKVVSAIENIIPCTALTATPEEMSIEVGAVGRIAATVTPETTTDKLSYTVEEAGASVASVDKNGRVTGLAAGTAKVTVKCGEQTAEVTVTVTEPTDGAKTLEKIDRLSTEGILPTAKPSAAQTKVVEQLVPGQTSTVKAVFDGQWCVPGLGTYEGAMQSNNVTDSIHSDDEASLYVHKIRLDIRKYVNVEVYATKDCTGSKITAKNITGTAGLDEHVINEYTVNSKTWSIKANYNGASYLHSVQLTVDSEPMPLQFTGVELPYETLSLTEDQSFSAPAKVLETGVEGVTVSYESSDPTTVAVDANGVVTALKGTGSATITATGTDGEVTKTDTMEVSIAGYPLPVAEPAVGTKYLFGLDQKGLGKYLYSTGEVSGNYAAVTELNEEAAKFELVAVEGGYNIKVTLAGGSVKYMNFETSESGDKSYANIKFNDEAKTTWKLDLTKQCVYAPVTFTTNTKNNGDYYIGTYNTNSTFSMSNISYLKPNSNNYAAWFNELGARPVVTEVTIDPSEVTLAPEATKTLSVTVLPALAAQKVTWASDAEGVATVDANGKVTAVADGTAHITATAKNGVVGTCTVTVDSSTGGEVQTDPVTINMKGFAKNSSTSYLSSEVTDDSTSITLASNNFIPSTGQVKGNQTSVGSNWYLYNTVALTGTLTKIVVSSTAIDGSNYFKGNLYVVYGDSTQASVTTLTGALSSAASTDKNSFTFDFTGKTGVKFFKICSNEKITNGSVKSVSVEFTFAK